MTKPFAMATLVVGVLFAVVACNKKNPNSPARQPGTGAAATANSGQTTRASTGVAVPATSAQTTHAGVDDATAAKPGQAVNEPFDPNRKTSFWPPYPDNPRVQYLVSFNSSADIQPQKGHSQTAIPGGIPEQDFSLALPYGLAMWKGRIYVADMRVHGVMIFDLSKHQTLLLGRSEADQMARPTDIAIADDGFKYVTDLDKKSIFVYDADDHFVTTFSPNDLQPQTLAVYQNLLFVCDKQKRRVVVMDRRDGKIVRNIGSEGIELGQFKIPLGIDVDSHGHIWVSDVGSCRVQGFDQDGKLLKSFGQPSDRAGGLPRPKMIAIDKMGEVFVVDAALQNVQVFDCEGKLLTYFGSAGTHPGNMNIPVGICVHEGDLDLFSQYIHPAFEAERLILVSNQFGSAKIGVYALGHLKPGKTPADTRAASADVKTGTTDAPQGR